jgi:hypothetical protein
MPVKYLNQNQQTPPKKSILQRLFGEKKNIHEARNITTPAEYQVEIQKELNPAVAARRAQRANIFRFLAAFLVILLVFVVLNTTGIMNSLLNPVSSQLSKPGALYVSSEYAKAEVFLNDKSLGFTPLELQSVAPGDYKVKVQASENPDNFFAPMEVPVTVTSGNATIIKAQLGPFESVASYITVVSRDRSESQPFPLIVNSIPTDAQILIDNTAVGRTPLNRTEIATGHHTIKLVKDGYKDIEVEIDVAPNKVIEISGKMYKYILDL